MVLANGTLQKLPAPTGTSPIHQSDHRNSSQWGRHANAWFGKSKLSVVERFINNLMRTGKFSGKKQRAKAYEGALDSINDRTGDNPLQSFIDAIVELTPCEEITRIKQGAVSTPKAVDSSPSRRLDIALKFSNRMHICYGWK